MIKTNFSDFLAELIGDDYDNYKKAEEIIDTVSDEFKKSIEYAGCNQILEDARQALIDYSICPECGGDILTYECRDYTETKCEECGEQY